jgi:hypothetical protein
LTHDGGHSQLLKSNQDSLSKKNDKKEEVEDLLNLSCTKKSLASLSIPSFIRGEIDQLMQTLVTHVQPSKLQILMQIQLKNKLMYAHVGLTMIKLARLPNTICGKDDVNLVTR